MAPSSRFTAFFAVFSTNFLQFLVCLYLVYFDLEGLHSLKFKRSFSSFFKIRTAGPIVHQGFDHDRKKHQCFKVNRLFLVFSEYCSVSL